MRKLFLHTLLMGLLALCNTQSLKALHPAFLVPFHEHMVEVNQQWLHQAEAIGELAEPTSFANDTERIQAHLWWVEKTLRERTSGLSLSPTQRQNRLKMLDALQRYQEAGSFPINTHHAYRIPYFIDAYGTPCAVGHLLIESGFEEVAERIHTEINNAYLREIPYKELPLWAEAHGFSLAELAWIQPGYPPTNRWKPVFGGTGANAPGNVIIEDSANGSLLVFGAFTEFNGVSCHGAVRIGPGGATPLDSIPLEGVKTALIYQGEIWVGGFFPDSQGNSHNIIRWDGSTWEPSTIGFGPVNCLHIHNGELYAGGDFPSAIYDNLAKYDTTSDWWSPFGSYLGPIYSMCSYQNELVVGGSFTSQQAAYLSYIARWDGSLWQPLTTSGDSLDAPVQALFADGQTLYAGGEIANINGGDYFGLAKLEAASQGQGWAYLLPNYSSINPLVTLDTNVYYINDIEVLEQRVYVAGGFFTETGLIYGTHFGVYDSAQGGTIVPLGDFSSPLADICISNRKIYATGPFVYPPGYVLETSDIFSSIGTDYRFEAMKIFPNPAREFVDFSWDIPAQARKIELDVYNISGQKLAVRYELQTASIRLFRDQLPAGAYAFVIRDGEQALNRGRFVFR